VEVTEGTRKVATVSQLGGTDPNQANVAVVKFSVRHAGQYKVAVMVRTCYMFDTGCLKLVRKHVVVLEGEGGISP